MYSYLSLATLETIRYDLNADGTYNDFVRVIDRNDSSLGRDTGFKLLAGTTIEHEATYTYNPIDGRLQQVSNPQISGHQFNYTYVPNSNLLDTITGPVHLVDNTWEINRDVLDIKENRVASTIISRYDYSVNAIGQRKTLAQSGTAFTGPSSIAWNYDSLGQVTQADHSSNIADRSYQYDAIGNRKKSAPSLNLPATDNHTANALNQYTTVPGHTGAIVHDPDGNLTQGSTPATSNLVWDAENRLIAATNTTTGITTTYRYDAFSRRISRSVGISPTTLFIHDAWNCIAEYQFHNSSFSLHTSYLWGTDLSGTMQGAGGVGGLLAVRSGAATRFPTYDGNGNITQYLTSTGTIAAHFEYDPFDNTVVNTDTTNQFAYRFSTKPLDQPTGLYYYGYRYYDPATGRWPSRDPIGEEGGVNLYGFVGNNGVSWLDVLGLVDCDKLKKQMAQLDDQLKNIKEEMSGLSNDLDSARITSLASLASKTVPALGSLATSLVNNAARATLTTVSAGKGYIPTLISNGHNAAPFGSAYASRMMQESLSGRNVSAGLAGALALGELAAGEVASGSSNLLSDVLAPLDRLFDDQIKGINEEGRQLSETANKNRDLKDKLKATADKCCK